MTLITHLWTEKINIIVSDRRLTNLSLDNPIVSESTIKTYSKVNNFVSFHGDYNINKHLNINQFLEKYYVKFEFENLHCVANHLKNKLKECKDREINTGFFIGGNFDKTKSLYYHTKSDDIIEDSSISNIGYRMNYENKTHYLELKKE